MGEKLIAGVHLVKHQVFSNENGKLYHHTRCDSSLFEKFGEVYISQTKTKVVKGWKLHQDLNQLMSVPSGKVLFILKDLREDSGTTGFVNHFEIGEDNYSILKIPKGVWYGFQTISEKDSLIVNLTDLPHNPQESLSKSLDDQEIGFSNWVD